jgi:hypothetical protein
MRGFFQDVLRDGNGVIISGGIVTVYLAGTTSLANIYSSVSSATPITGSVVTTAANGSFSFYCDAFDYGTSQCFKYVATATTFAGQSYTLDNIDVFANPVMGNYTITGGKTTAFFMSIPSGVRYVKGSGNLTFNGGFQAGQYRVFSSYTKGVDVIFGITPLVIWDIWYDGVSTTGTLNVSSTGTVTTINATTINSTTENVTNDNVSGTTSTNTISPYTGGGAVTIAGTPIRGGYVYDSLGANVASAGTITPTGSEFHITGALAISTINLPYAGFNGKITVIPDGLFTWTAGGNIALAGQAIVSQNIIFEYDSNIGKWYPSPTNSGNLPMTGEVSNTSGSSPVVLSLGSVTAGDRVYVEGGYTYSFGSDTFGYTQAIITNTGNCTINCGKDRTSAADIVALPHSAYSLTPEHWFSRVIQVTVSGTLTLSLAVGATYSGTQPTYANIELYAFFLKKQ